MATENFEKTESKADIMTLEYCYAPEYMPIAKAALAKVHGFQWKNDDVVVATFPRSGTHFVWILTRMLVQGSADPILDAMEDSHVWLPGFTDSQTGRRVLNTHFYIPDVDDSIFKEGNRKFIYVCRNCKDVSVSQFNIYKKFRVFTETMAPHNWEEYLPKCYNFIPGLE